MHKEEEALLLLPMTKEYTLVEIVNMLWFGNKRTKIVLED
jgi:hypothetical protein